VAGFSSFAAALLLFAQLKTNFGLTGRASPAPQTQCTTGKERRIKRWEHEAVIDAMQDRLDRALQDQNPRKGVRTEMSLHVLAYNLKRVIAIVGAQPLMEAMRA
jgi:hypothetical protein